MTEVPFYIEQLQRSEKQRSKPLTVAHRVEQIVWDTGRTLIDNCAAIAQWIDTRSKAFGDMFAKAPEELALMIEQGRAVMVMEPGDDGYQKVVGFCGLTMTHPEGETPLAWELGAMIKGDTVQSHIGLLLLVETLKLPKALELEAVVAYCNPTSYHIMVEKAGGVDASDEVLAMYHLEPWGSDKIVDLTHMRNQLQAHTRRSAYGN